MDDDKPLHIDIGLTEDDSAGQESLHNVDEMGSACQLE